MTYLCGLNKDQFQTMMDDLANSYLNGCDEYPKTLVEAYNYAIRYKGVKPRNKKGGEGIAFATEHEDSDEQEEYHATSGKVLSHKGVPVRFYLCKKNHYLSDCPKNSDRVEKDHDK